MLNPIHSEVTKFLSAQPLQLFIGGQWTDAIGGGTLETCDPGSGKVLARVAAGESADVDRAVAAAC